MTHLSLSLLGPFQATLDGQPIAGFRANKVRALLAYLAVEAGRPHPRSVLAALLWPERPERAALASLRNALAILRTAIGDRAVIGDRTAVGDHAASRLRDATSPFLLVTRETIQFNPAADYWLDVAAFQALLEATQADRPDHERLEEAVALCRGDFLQGFSVGDSPDFEDWALLVRERLQRRALDALRRLIAHYERRGEIGRACEAARRQVELAPWEEEAHRGLMRLLALNGQRAAALAQYEACRQALAEELGVEPAEETVALYEQIRAGQLERALPHPDRALETVPRSPAFLDREAERERPGRPAFVAREKELARLDGFLDAALAGGGRVAFLTGEAGTGKTSLAGAFARRAQERHASLLVATGNCNAYTGAGDPYLPFREILGQLTGDVEARWAAGALSTQGARRLWHTVPLAVQALLESSPGLVGSLLSGPSLAARVAQAAPDGAPWRSQLEALLASDGTGRGQPGLRPADLHAQVTAFLSALAQRHPLLLVLDDLQWADADSIDLLFHLGRRLAGSRILIAGLYRSSEVVLGQQQGLLPGARHPQRASAFASVVHEFERQFGEIAVHLPQVGERAFVESFLDSEPNRLGPDFREALYGHTQGHALCVVEMLRDMQERGDLVRDGKGRWVEGPAMNWASLPARCEGVIGTRTNRLPARVEAIIRARIDRLPAVLRQTLQVASVEGETFTAEVVARVRGLKAYEVVAQLSGELDRRHRLLAAEGSQPLSPGEGRASRYRFRHILLQQYAYSRLDEAERAYLHEAVGDALERIYAGQTGAIAVQLARHYNAAGRMDKAADYSMQAGDQARGLYAYVEARQHYDRALEAAARLPDTDENRTRRVEVLITRVDVSLQTDPPEQSLARLAEVERLVLERSDLDKLSEGDRLRLARIRLLMGQAHYLHGAYLECVPYYEQALSVAREMDDAELTISASMAIGRVTALQGHHGKALEMFSQTLSVYEQTGQRSKWLASQGFYGVAHVMTGNYATGLAAIQRTHAWAKERHALFEIAQSNFYLNAAHIQGGDLTRAQEAARRAAEAFEQLGDRVYVYIGRFHQSWAACCAGQYRSAAAYAARAEAIAQELGGRLVHADDLAAVHAAIAFGVGRMQKAIDLSKRAVGIAQEMGGIFAEGKARRTWGQALAALVSPRWDEAEGQLTESLRLLESGQNRLEAARTHVAWGAVCHERGDLAGARAHWEQAGAQWEASGLDHELARTRALIKSLEPG